MNQPAQLHFDLLELSWWQYPQVWIGIGVILLLLLGGCAYWCWKRVQELRRPLTPVEELRKRLVEVAADCEKNALNSYEEQSFLYMQLCWILRDYARLCLKVPDIASTDGELLTYCDMFMPKTEVTELMCTVLDHGQHIKFARKMFDVDMVRCEAVAVLGMIQKEIDACRC